MTNLQVAPRRSSRTLSVVTLLGLALCEVCAYSGRPGAYSPLLEAGIWTGLALFILGMVVLVHGGVQRAKALRLEGNDARVAPKEFRWAMLAGVLLLNAGIWISAFLPGRPLASPVFEFVGMTVMLISLEPLS